MSEVCGENGEDVRSKGFWCLGEKEKCVAFNMSYCLGSGGRKGRKRGEKVSHVTVSGALEEKGTGLITL